MTILPVTLLYFPVAHLARRTVLRFKHLTYNELFTYYAITRRIMDRITDQNNLEFDSNTNVRHFKNVTQLSTIKYCLEISKIYREITAKFLKFTAKLPPNLAYLPRNLGFWAVAVPPNLAHFTATNLCPSTILE